MNVADRAHLETFLTAIDASPTALERPVCRGWVGDYQVTGKHGHVLADGAGFLLYVGTNGSVRRWTNVNRQLSFCRLTGSHRMVTTKAACISTRLPTENEAAAIRNCLRRGR
jgi:hypothetical protein